MAHPKVVAAAMAALPWAQTVVGAAVAAGYCGAHAAAAAAAAGNTQAARRAVMPRAALRDEELYWCGAAAVHLSPQP
jgi:1,3-beta-glucan synthase